MKRTIIRIEKEDGAPPEIEINGRPMKGPFERAALYAAALFVAIGILFLVVYVVLPLLGIALGAYRPKETDLKPLRLFDFPAQGKSGTPVPVI